jgi:hypothetical protein
MRQPSIPKIPAIECRRWLASEGDGSVDTFIAWTNAFAGKPAPTGHASAFNPENPRDRM